MWIRDRLSRQNSSQMVAGLVGENEAAGSSSSTVNSSAPPNRLSTVKETNDKIDIEQAIHLLQELRKTASPQELVALHKALLPTRDSVVPSSPSIPLNEDSRNDSTASLIRHRSMLPPGLATRTTPEEDLLRRQEDVPVVKKKKSKKGTFPALKEAPSKSDLAALDLANQPTQAQPRATTPSDDLTSSLGSYSYGTLRVTNGAASPVPSLASLAASVKKSAEVAPPVPIAIAEKKDKKLRNSFSQKSSLEKRASEDYFTAPNTPLDRPSMEFYNAHTGLRDSAGMFDWTKQQHQTFAQRQSEGERRSRERSRTRQELRSSRSRDASISGIPAPAEVDESSPRIYKPMRPRKSRENSRSNVPQSRESSQHRPTRSRENSLSRIPLRVEPSKPNLQQRVSAQSLTPLRPEADDGRISPLPSEVPRFAQRWSHRASKLAEDYNSDSDTSGAASYGDINTLRQYEDPTALFKRLSTVYDGECDDEDATATETREAALSKLNGIEDGQIELTLETHITSLNERPAPSPQSGNDSILDRPSPQQHADSGYGTDSSFQGAVHAKKSLEQQRATRLYLVPDEGELRDQGDGMSLYSFNQILKSPDLLNGFATPSPPAATSNKKSFFNLAGSKRASPNLAIESADEAAAGSPMDVKAMKSKKLQKPMPESIRQERKAKMKKTKEERRDSEAPEPAFNESTHEIPAVPVELASTNEKRFSFEPIPRASTTAPPTPTARNANQLQSEVHQSAAELTGDEGFASADEGPARPKRSVFRKSSKRRSGGRPRSWSLHVPTSDETALPEKSDRRRSSQAASPSKNVFGVGPISCISGAGPSNDKGSDLDIPLWTDHASVSRTLGCSPYDLSTGLFKRTVALPSTVTHQIQAPHEITTNLARSKTGGLRGMDSGMASELARMKSRDVAINKNEEVYERPRTAKPKNRKDKSKSEPSVSVPPRIDGHPKSEPNVDTALNIEIAELPARSNSMYSESIPPMPELPADVHAKVNRMDERAARKIRDSAQPTPPESTRNSDERPGDSTMTVAEAIRRARSQRKLSGQSGNSQQEDGNPPRNRPTGPRKKKSQRIEAREISSSGSDATVKDKQVTSEVQQTADAATPAPEAEKPTLTGFEKQAEYWRQQCESLGQSLPKLKVEDATNADTATAQANATASSPAMVVSRHISSQSVGTQPTVRQRKDSASLQADAYRALIGEADASADERESQEIVTATPVTVHRLNDKRPATVVVTSPSPKASRSPMSPISPLTLATEPIERARSPGGRVITPSGNYHPYTPADAAHAERSRAESLAKLTGTPVYSSTVKTTTTVKTTRPVRRATADTFAPSHASRPSVQTYAPPKPFQRPQSPRQAPHYGSQHITTPKSAPPKQANAIEALFDRYSGGLEYNFEKGAGFAGSAGTRGRADLSGRKSKELSESFGVDLSDVPVMLRKVGPT